MTSLSRFACAVAVVSSACLGVSPAFAASTVSLPDLIVRNVHLDKVSPQQTTLDFAVTNVGKAPTKDLFAIAIYVDGKIFKHTFYRQVKPGKTYHKGPNTVVPLGPRKSNRFSVGGFATVAAGTHRIKVVVDQLDSRDPALGNPILWYDSNMIIETDEGNNASFLLVRN